MTTTYHKEPVVGYGDGLIKSDESPEHTVEKFNDDRNDNHNNWFTIGDTRYNVHPYRSDFGGYPVRWTESV